MKHKSIIGICLFALALIAVKVYADTLSISIQNSSSSTIGTVRLNLTTTTYDDESIGGTGLYGPYSEPSLISITINGFTVGKGVKGIVYLSDNTPISVTWAGDETHITLVIESN